MRNSLARRVLWVHVILLLALCGVLLRIFVIGQGEQYRQTAAAQSRYTLSAGTARGNIYDCRLRPLVNESEKTVLAVDPTPAAMTALRQGLSAEQFEEIYPLLQSGRPVLLPSDFPISGEASPPSRSRSVTAPISWPRTSSAISMVKAAASAALNPATRSS